MWRYNAARTASSPQQLAPDLHLQWARKLPKPQPAWPYYQYKLQFDLSYEPVVMGKTIFVPSMTTDSITAYETASGVQKWRFYCDGPVRFAPIAWQNNLYFASDDGHLYCVNAENGQLKWKFRGGPSDRQVLGNDRLISTWPARGAPVLYDETIYFAAGIWPFMGTFIHALDAKNGDLVWTNSSTGPIFTKQPHNEPAFSGVAPQGYIAASKEKLIITGGRSRPAGFDRKTGKLLYFNHNDNSQGKFRGGYDVAIWKDWYFNFDVMFDITNGHTLSAASAAVFSKDSIIGFHSDGDLMAYTPQAEGNAKGIWKSKIEPKLDKIHIQAGNRIYGSKGGLIAAVDVPEGKGTPSLSWQKTVPGTVFSMIAADNRLFVVTKQGMIYCYGPDKTQPQYFDLIKTQFASQNSSYESILDESVPQEGYCLLLGVGSGGLLADLLKQTQLHIIVIDPDSEKIANLRAKLCKAGLYGTRAAAQVGDLDSVELPQYFANLIVSEDIVTANEATIKKLFSSLRPYGGTALLPSVEMSKLGLKWKHGDWIPRAPKNKLTKTIQSAKLPGSSMSYNNGLVSLKRTGALPGSADWTHQFGDIANTVCSKDQLVKAPLGLLWFGDRADFGDVLPRHGHGPPEQVIEGRLFLQGIDSISARDVYTGRILWKTPLEGLNAFNMYYDESYVDDFHDTTYNQNHLAGANARGTNFIATADSVYVIEDRSCNVLDAGTGKSLQTITIPDYPSNEPAEWGYIGVYEDYLIAGAGFAEFSRLIGADKEWLKWNRYVDRIASRQLVVMDRHSGRGLWSRPANFGYTHNAIAVGKGKIFCLDKLPPFVTKSTEKSNESDRFRLFALDVRSGKVLWEKDRDLFGGWLGYSEEYDILIQGDWPEGDRMGPWKHADRIIAYKGSNGKVLWDKPIKYKGPYILHHDTIITQRSQGRTARAFSLLTGQEKMRIHPLTGETVPWEFMRLKGCNTTVGSEHLLTFRSSAAGYFDLANDGGTGNLGGFKSGCTSNLIAANGILNAPDYTQTCTCSYQNQTSLGLVHMPDADMWTFNTIQASDKPITRIGINFGAPGDRKASDGTLWVDYPSVGGHSPQVRIKVSPTKPEWYRYDSSHIKSGPVKWVTASGVEGLEEVRITLAKDADYKGIYTVKLYFAETEHTQANQRIFDVNVQGQKVLENFDIVDQAGSNNAGIVKEFSGVEVGQELVVTLTGPQSPQKAILSGIELIAETGK